MNGVTSSGIADPSLEIIKVLSRFAGVAGVEVVAGLDGFGAFLDATLAQVCFRTAGGSGGGFGSPGGRVEAAGGGGAEPEGPA